MAARDRRLTIENGAEELLEMARAEGVALTPGKARKEARRMLEAAGNTLGGAV